MEGMEILSALLHLLFFLLCPISIFFGLWAWALYIGSNGDIAYLAIRTPFNKVRNIGICTAVLAASFGIVLLITEIGTLPVFGT